jgi:ribulose-bisphosphate carboxylase large chain
VPSKPKADDTAPVIRRFRRGYRWDKIELEPYKRDGREGSDFRGASRQVLIGKHGEQVGFHLRYFELEPGGFTTLERHRHSHVVIGVRGRGRIRVGEARYSVAPFDTIYVAPYKQHQLSTIGRSKFGFFCVVNAKRDKPVRLSELIVDSRGRMKNSKGRS